MRRRTKGARRLRAARGYTLIETLTVMTIMGVVMAGLTQIFTSASAADRDMANRFQAQQTARLALDKLRRDIHCATDVTPYATNAVTIRLPSGCGGDTSYCTAAMSGVSGRWALYRQVGSSCGAGTGIKLADYLTSANVFPAFAPHSTASLSSLSVDLPVQVTTRTATGAYDLQDTIYLRNSTRT